MSSNYKNNFVIDVATVNGSGSQSSNSVLLKTIFNMGIPVAGKNLFPSNIQGLSTWYRMRINNEGFTSFSETVNIKIAMNKSTFEQDLKQLHAEGLFIYNADFKIDPSETRSDIISFGVPFKNLLNDVTKSGKLKKLLINMTYVGAIGPIIGLKKELLIESIENQFSGKKSAVAERLIIDLFSIDISI